MVVSPLPRPGEVARGPLAGTGRVRAGQPSQQGNTNCNQLRNFPRVAPSTRLVFDFIELFVSTQGS